MHKEAREAFNRSFTESKYKALANSFETDFPGQLDFRIAETPIFVPKELLEKINIASEQIIDTLRSPEFIFNTERAVPADQNVPNENTHTSFLAIDFAICKDEKGELTPQLIELQGFPSVFGYQAYLSEAFKKHFEIPDNFRYSFGADSYEEYVAKLKELILAGEDPEQVILLEIFPEKQKTRIDFAVTESMLGIQPVCYTKLIKEGRDLFYEKDGRKIQIKRIYNRLIFDDLLNYPDLKTSYHFTDDVNVSWVGHPNWFFRISKFSIPFLKSDYIPETKFVSHYEGNFPADLENYVLKPLFSFAGSGVQLHVSESDLVAIPDPENYILQRKVVYEPVIQAPDGLVKCEIRMMYGWNDNADKPELLISLSRLSRGEMIGVRFNKDFTWVGGSAAFFEK
ncbi:hypothetical protein [Dyadobacter fanqingshengii]|uniref:Circularly permuted type 2 ATP-grasp protein n=1 Tax=Dyadobacter fanqingshengii TaxID=2906443 RepID=A0A9X1P8J7_9BACT|nr:hypothetical protein [Dyadobacter fanqingshengii]MCF0040719.1 hypothetical protein [Dyadobacter fanqingshengii]USJ37544.1 hypothetical protein NFI81_07130 [Dyadobacter fanqingshengii]